LILIIFCILGTSFGWPPPCQTIYGQVCLDKTTMANAGMGSSFGTNPGPCFDNGGTQNCYIGLDGSMTTCDMTICSTPPPPPPPPTNLPAPASDPTCSLAPAPDCTADQAWYCKYIGSTSSVCKYCGYNAANCGGGLCLTGIPAAAQQLIVDTHNNLRNKVAKGLETQGSPGPQPTAANMVKLVWDDELAKVVQVWALQCVGDHDACTSTPNLRGGVGQNYAGGTGDSTLAVDWAGLVNDWYKEVAFFPKGNVSPWSTNGAPKETGHYTQLVWAQSARVGCGFVQAKTGQQNLFCNYWPPGNVGGGIVYQLGAPASACPPGTTPEDGLCKQN